MRRNQAWQSWTVLTIAFVVTISLAYALADDAAAPNTKTGRVIEIKSSVTIDSSMLGAQLVVTASNITIDGGGATSKGEGGIPKAFKGTAISARGVSHVTLKNFNASGWETGLKIVDGEGWTIENCDFSGNFHDPDFGWGENGRRGGIVLENVRKSVLRKNKANRVWDGCVLVDSNDNTLEENDLSHTSNTCLKLWHSSRNVIQKNVLSHGIRIKPGEVHARDSTSVLIESGSNDNRFLENDCTYGGDGIFVRVLNGWCSTGNLFEKNDCSYANNNGVECWARDNVFRSNKANYCSYGFWMGGSDHTRLEGNEASFNGLKEGNHNSPHLPASGHAGIVFMFGPSSHTVARGNTCIGNNGAGIAVIGDLGSAGQKWKARHWIIEDNLLAQNRWGLFLQYADWIQVSGNRFHDKSPAENNNSLTAIQVEAGVSRLSVDRTVRTSDERRSIPKVTLSGPTSALVGQEVRFSVEAPSPRQTIAWDFGDGSQATSAEVRHTFSRPGFYRVGVNVSNPEGTELAWRDFYAVEAVTELGTDGDAADWSIEDFHDRVRSNEQTSRADFVNDMTENLVGKSSLRVVIHPYAGFRAALTYPRNRNADWSLAGKSKLVFWMKVINEDVTGWQGGPFFVLHGENNSKCHIEPRQGLDLMRQVDDNEGRDGWRRMEIPLQSNDKWQVDGPVPTQLRAISMAFDSWGAPTLRIWIDGLALE